MSMQRGRDGEVRILRCDHPSVCPRLFDGTLGERLAAVRRRARHHDWLCQNPAAGRPALDLCPDHRREGVS